MPRHESFTAASLSILVNLGTSIPTLSSSLSLVLPCELTPLFASAWFSSPRELSASPNICFVWNRSLYAPHSLIHSVCLSCLRCDGVRLRGRALLAVRQLRKPHAQAARRMRRRILRHRCGGSRFPAKTFDHVILYWGQAAAAAGLAQHCPELPPQVARSSWGPQVARSSWGPPACHGLDGRAGRCDASVAHADTARLDRSRSAGNIHAVGPPFPHRTQPRLVLHWSPI